MSENVFEITETGANSVNSISATIHAQCLDAGWYTDLETGRRKDRNIAEVLCLVHSEISEALEGYRKGLMDDHLPHRPMLEVELADAMIRMHDLAGYLGLDLGGAMREKFAYNQRRADHKLDNRRAAGGKKI